MMRSGLKLSRTSKKFSGLFVTGTGTDVGKTLVACALAYLLKNAGVDVGVMKPFASGAQKKSNGRWVAQDALDLMQAAGSSDAIDQVNPSCFSAPLAPQVAAAQEKKPIAMPKVWSAYRHLQRRHEFLLVEGVGGIAVPIAPKLDVADFAVQLGLPCIVVANSQLGTLNHTLLTLQYLKQKKLPCLGIILNFYDSRRLTDRTNLDYFQKAGILVLACIPEHKRGTKRPQWLAKHLNNEKINSIFRTILKK